MTGAIHLYTQHQISFSDEIFAPLQEYESDMQISKSASVDDSKEVLPLLEPEMGISEKDMSFLLRSIESFGPDCKCNDNFDELCLPSGIDDYEKRNRIQSDTEKNHSFLLDECSSDLQMKSSTALESLLIKPIALTLSANQLPELDLGDCFSISEESNVEGYSSIFDEADSDHDDIAEPVHQPSSNISQNFSNEDSSLDIMPTAVKSSTSCDDSLSFSIPCFSEGSAHIKPYQEKNWLIRYKQLQQFRKEEGHCCVPSNHPKFQKLANWVKRQRREYKNMKNGRSSAMTIERINMLESINFIWNSHDIVWIERLEALKVFRSEVGHCNVPYRYSKDKQLGTWVKGQRHQYKLYREGKSSSMNPRRIFLLTSLGFEWVGKSCTSSTSTQL